MLDCLIIGDSIAHGIHSVKPDCVHITEIGVTTSEWYHKNSERPLLGDVDYRLVIISLTNNDKNVKNSRNYLHKIRQKIKSQRVVWILPTEKNPEMRSMVEDVAYHYQDHIMDISSYTGVDRVHPPTVRAYEQIAKGLK
jgi:hypothetical protein